MIHQQSNKMLPILIQKMKKWVFKNKKEVIQKIRRQIIKKDKLHRRKML